MTLDQMVKELNDPLKSFVNDFVKDIYENRDKEIDASIFGLLNMLKDRYIKD